MKKCIVLSIFALPFLFSCSNEIIRDKQTGMNGSFEIVKNNLPVNWYIDHLQDALQPNAKSANTFQVYSDSLDYVSGNRSLAFAIQQCSPRGFGFSPGLFEEFEAVPGADYEVSFWIKNTSTHYRISISAITAKGGSKEINPVEIIESSNDSKSWEKHTIKKHIPKDLDRIRIGVELVSPGTFKIDDITLNRIS